MWHNNFLGFVEKYIGKTHLYFVLLFVIASNVGVINICYAQQPRTSWHIYRNVKNQYQLCYPDFMLPQGESDNGDGQKFIDTKGGILTVYGRYLIEDIDPQNLQQFLQEEIKNAVGRHDKITYQVVRENWAVISGVNQKHFIFYHKYIVDADNRLLVFQLIYPESQQQLYKRALPKISSCFQSSFDIKIKK